MNNDIITENLRRQAQFASPPYDPLRGIGCHGRRTLDPGPFNHEQALVPQAMIDDPRHATVASRIDWQRLRCRHDFEYWAATCVKIRHKVTGHDVPFILNAPQRRVLAMLEDDRLARRPIRLIMLKARQWGGSTLIQMYFAWVQIMLRRNWHSVICAHVKDTAATIRGMYSAMLRSYPSEIWDEKEKPEFKSFEASRNTRLIAGRGCRVTLGSSERQDSIRGSDFAMAHLSEVAFWSDSSRRSPEAFIKAIAGSVPLEPLTIVVMESTANGVGTYFHTEWLRAKEGSSDKRPVFVPWYEIEIYRKPVDNPEQLWQSLTPYEKRLWDMGLTLEMIAWYHAKRREAASDSMMQAEYPTDDTEAFVNTGYGVFAIEAIERLRADCHAPVAVGELAHGHFSPDPTGALKIWKFPVEHHQVDLLDRYVAVVDIGGRSIHSDHSVIAVFDRGNDCARPEVVAQWRGHIDHDLLAEKAAAIARWYHNALLVVESNSLESDSDGAYTLAALNRSYPNLYVRYREEASSPSPEPRPGFHTNRSTKLMAVDELIARVRDHRYIERDTQACNELCTYERRPNGSYAAKPGHHDDILMTRAIGLLVIRSLDPRPIAPFIPARYQW